MNTFETTLYFVGTDVEDAQNNAPFDTDDAASSFQEDAGGHVYSARALVNADSIVLASFSPSVSAEQFTPSFSPNPFTNGLNTTLFLAGTDADAATECLPFMEESDALETAVDNGFYVYSVQAFVDLDSLQRA